MENKIMYHLSGKRTIALLLLYFVGYSLLLPGILVSITLSMNPNAETISIPLSMIGYILTIIFTVWITKPLLQDSFKQLKSHFLRNVLMMVVGVFAILIVNLILGVIISFFTESVESANQQVIAENAVIAPFFTLFASTIFAPIVEECVFRGGVFTYLRKKHSFLFAMMISSILFGFIHVLDSLLSGNYADLIFLLVYTGLGFVLSYSYEKTNSIYVSMVIHLGNNLIAFLAMMSTL